MSGRALLPNAGDLVLPDELLELRDLLGDRRVWRRLGLQAALEGPIAALLETMHIDGQDYTFQQLRHYIEKQAGVFQEGAFDFNDYLVAQRAAGANMSVDVAAGDAWVKMDTGTRNGLYLQTNDGTVNVPIAAAHATLPRIDQIVLQVNDSNVSGVSNTPELKVLAGTPTSGATLDNRTGAAALGNDRLLLADVLVPAASSSVVDANIRDRRKRARGNAGRAQVTSNVASALNTWTPREPSVTLEIGSGRVRLVLAGSTSFSNSSSSQNQVRPVVDGVLPALADGGTVRGFGGNSANPHPPVYQEWILENVAAGRRKFQTENQALGVAGGFGAGATNPVECLVEELPPL